ncbi:MAG TPA: MFS transporter [Streptosporangiaceae bacterium]|nr:MFS transporter [Streptosporangiaceae bacterium]
MDAPYGLTAEWLACADGRARPPLVPISVLGLLTIIGYGACYYAYGVLIGPISTDTGWPDAALGAIFSAALTITGAGGIAAGRVLDRCGPRPGFLLAGIAGAGAMLAASAQDALLPFAIAYAGGCGLVGALGFYHITQAVAARTAPATPARAIIWLTLFGALSSPVYLPLTAWLTQSAGWRAAIRVEAGTVAVAFVLAAILIKNPGVSEPGQPGGRPAGGLRVAWRSPLVRAWLAATLIGGAAVNALIVYQVPVTTRAGLPLGIAAAVAGFRGLAQLAGRLPLTALTSKLGARITLVLAYIVAAAVTLLLFAGGALAPVLVLSLFAGAAIGAVYSLQGVYAYELIDPRHLGSLLGIQQAVFAAGGALGSLTAGTLLGATGSGAPAVTVISAGFAAAAGILLLGRAPGPAAVSDSAAGQDRT